MMSMQSLILHSDHVPGSARSAIRAANSAHPHERAALLKSAASILVKETGLDCADVLELMDLSDKPCGC